MDFHYEKGADLTVRVNGNILGGVTKLRRTVKNQSENIYQFLTDKPVAKLPVTKYELTFWLRCQNGCVFDGDIHEIAIEGRRKTETYTLCAVKEIKSEAEPRGYTEYTVAVEAEERSVADE